MLCILVLSMLGATGARGEQAGAPDKLALATSLSGSGEFAGHALLDAVRFAVDEANAAGGTPVALAVHDDHSAPEGAMAVAQEIADGDAVLTIGPAQTATALAAGPVYAANHLVSIVPTVHGDAITRNATTFRTVFSTSEIGDALANYLHYVLGGRRVVVLYRDNGYGQPFAAGVRRVAERFGIAATFRAFTTPAEREAAAALAAAAPDEPAVFLGMTYEDAMPVLVTLRRLGTRGAIFGTATMARASFAALFADQPEEHVLPGFFTNGVYAASPMILDSAGAEMLAFADRFRAATGHEPSWETAQAYDATRLAIGAMRATAAARDLPARRAAVLDYLSAFDGPAHAMATVTGPLWFGPNRARQQPVRVGRFDGTAFDSAPLQLVPVSTPDPAEIASGSLVALGGDRFARRQQVVYTGVFVNEIQRVDIPQSRFTADFYLWVRYAAAAGPGAADPTDIDFPDLIRGSSDGKLPAAQGDLADGTTYRLWRLRGDFKNDFDLHHYPADRQTLTIRLFNAGAASDRLIYVQDRSAGTRATLPGAQGTGVTARGALDSLTQWEPSGARERRESLVTPSALGDPRLVGLERSRELSGFGVSIDLRRRLGPTVLKTLLPLGLMALIIFATLFFPIHLIKEKVTVATTGALSAAVLLASINTQLGTVGYVIAVEYLFYVVLALCLLCLVCFVTAERLRAAAAKTLVPKVERAGRYVYLCVLVGTVGTAWLALSRW